MLKVTSQRCYPSSETFISKLSQLRNKIDDKVKMNEICSKCSRPAAQRCSGCDTTLYCSKECQEADLLNHAKKCREMKEVESSSKASLKTVRMKTQSLIKAFGNLESYLRGSLWHLLRYANRRPFGVVTPHWVLYVTYSDEIDMITTEEILPLLREQVLSLLFQHVMNTPKYQEYFKFPTSGQREGLEVSVVTTKKILEDFKKEKGHESWLPELTLEWKEQPVAFIRTQMREVVLISPIFFSWKSEFLRGILSSHLGRNLIDDTVSFL